MNSTGNECEHDNCKCSKKEKKVPIVMPVTPRNKIGRNEPCPCRSGKKFKKCCLTKRTYTPGG